MANFIIGHNFASVAGVTTNSAATNFPGVNAIDYTHPSRHYEATGVTTSEYLAIDLGTATSVAGVLVYTNVDKLTVRVDDDNASAWDYSAADQTVSKDELDGRYKFWVAPAETRRYVRLEPGASAAAQDGSGVWKVHAVAILTSITTFTNPFGFPYDRVSITGGLANADFAGGGREPVDLGNRYARISVTQPVMPTDGESDLFELTGTVTQGTPLVFYRNGSSTAEGYVCRRVGATTIRQAGPAHYGVDGITLETVP